MNRQALEDRDDGRVGLLQKDLYSGVVHLLDEGRIGGDSNPGERQLLGGDFEVHHRSAADVDAGAEVIELSELLVRGRVPGALQAAARRC